MCICRVDKIGAVHRKIDRQLEERHRLATAAIKWTQQKEMPHGHPLLHQRFAVTYWKGKQQCVVAVNEY